MSKFILPGGIGIFFLILAGCGTTPPEDDVWVLIDRGKGLEAEAFFRAKNKVNDRDRRGRTPLHAAAEVEDEILAGFLIVLGADVNARDNQNRTPLTISTDRNDAKTAHRLATAGADIHYRAGTAGRSPAEYAVEPGREDFLTALLTRDPVAGDNGDQDEEPSRPGNIEALKSADQDGQTILHLAVNEGNVDAVRFILDLVLKEIPAVAGKEDNGGKTALDLALAETESRDHAEIAAILIDPGMVHSKDPLYDYFGPAVLKSNYAIRFYDGGIPDGGTLLHYTAAARNYTDAEGNTTRRYYKGFIEFILDQYLEDEINLKNTSGAAPLHEAVRSGNTAAVELLINGGADLNARDANGNTPLHIAAPEDEEYRKILPLLLGGGANPNIQDDHGDTPLHVAVSLNRTAETVNTLIGGKALVDIRNKDGKTPLYMAVEKGRKELIGPLLAQGADIFAADNQGRTPLTAALQGKPGDTAALKDPEILKALITPATIRRFDNGGNTLLHIAVKSPVSKDALGVILGHPAVKPDIRNILNVNNKEGNTGLHLALPDNEDAGKLLIAAGADIFTANARGQSPLYLMFEYRKLPWLETERVLTGPEDGEKNVLKRAKDSLGNGVLHYAALWKREDLQIRWLVNKGAEIDAPNAAGETPLFWAVRADSPPTIQTLLTLGARKEARDNQRNTALHTAARWNAKAAAEALLSGGLSPDSQAQDGRAPIHLAVQYGAVEIEQLLVKQYRANIEIRDNEGNTPLMLAVKTLSPQAAARAVERLIESGANALTSDVRGDTPLHKAVERERGQEELIGMLLSKGASIHIENAQGKSPFLLALALPDPEPMVSLLLKDKDRVNLPDDKGSPPLHIAITAGAPRRIIDHLIDVNGLKANLSAIDAQGNTPLRLAINLAIVKDDWDLAKHLAEAGSGSDLFFNAGDRRNPADLALEKGRSAVNVLFPDGRRINDRDSDGNTILHYAARRGDPGIISHLIDLGADKNLRNIAGETPAEIAQRLGRPPAVISQLR